jgi:hypothetical protein
MVPSRPRRVQSNNRENTLLMVARIAPGPASSQPRSSSERRRPRPSAEECGGQVCCSLFAWLCFLAVVLTFAVTLQFAAVAIPTTLASATVRGSIGYVAPNDDSAARQPGLSPIEPPGASTAAPSGRQCHLGARVPSEVLVSMTMEELVYLEDTQCPRVSNGSTT